MGRPIAASGITKIEQGTRRVDVDDLVALALAFDVSPNRLLLEPESDNRRVALTDGVKLTRLQAWDWATGAAPIPRRAHFNADFRRLNRPNEPEGAVLRDLPALEEKLKHVKDTIQAVVDKGSVTWDQVLEYLQLQHELTRVQATTRRKRG